MQDQSTTTLVDSPPEIAVLESICDVLDALGTEHLSSPLRSARLHLHMALSKKDTIPAGDICRTLSEALGDIAAEARRMGRESPFSQGGVTLSDSGAPETLSIAGRLQSRRSSPKEQRTSWLSELDDARAAISHLLKTGYEVPAAVLTFEVDGKIAEVLEEPSRLRLNQTDATKAQTIWAKARNLVRDHFGDDKSELLETAWRIYTNNTPSPYRLRLEDVFSELKPHQLHKSVSLGSAGLGIGWR